MQRIPPVDAGDRLELVTATGPGTENDTCPYELTYRAVSVLICPHCGRPHRVGRRSTVKVKDLPFGDHPVLLTVEEGSAYCRVARERLLCGLPDRQGTLTGALVRYLQRHFGQEPRRILARRTCVSEATIRQVQMKPHRTASLPPENIDYLGVDDIYMLRGRYLVATDLSRQTIVALECVGTVVEGRASAVDMQTFFSRLPDVEVVTLDMHAQQMEEAKARWPTAKLVIDKRHLLGIVDRDLLRLVSEVVFGRFVDLGDMIAAQQAVRSFGLKAYPYLSLRALVLRRRRNLTPADHAAWTLLLLEGRNNPRSPTQQLWQAYQWREALYEVYDASKPAAVIRTGLERWKERVEDWRRQGENEPPDNAPFPRISWAMRTHWTQILNYTDTGVTNATTELINGRLRAYLRRGHRYNPEALIALVNQEAAANALSKQSPPPVSSVPAAGALPVPTLLSPAAPRAPHRRPSRSRRSIPAVGPMVTWEIPAVSPRLLPRQAPELNIPQLIWQWLHGRVDSGRGHSGRWLHRVLQTVEGTDEAAMWRLCCAGQIRGADGLIVTPAALDRWRAAVHHRFVVEQPKGLRVLERERQSRLRGLQMNTVHDCCPNIHAGLLWTYERMTDVTLADPAGYSQDLLAFIESWHQFYSGNEPFRSTVLKARPWRSWSERETFDEIEPSDVEPLLMNAPLAWAVHLEWFVNQHPTNTSSNVRKAWRTDRLNWPDRFIPVLQHAVRPV